MTVLTDAWHRFAALTSPEKAAFLVFGAVMNLFVVGQVVLVVWLLLIGFR